MANPLVYLILGCKGTGQFQVVSDLIDFGTDKDERSALFYSIDDANDAEDEFSVRTRDVTRGAYGWTNGVLSLEVGSEPDLVFVVADGLADPADFVEAFHAWLPESGCDLGRVMTVLYSELAIRKRETFAWFDCCIHYSDVVLLAKRENISNKEMKQFLDHYEEECFPCIFEYVKKGRVASPKLLLETQPRRISRIFDVPEIFEDDEESEIEEEEVAGDPTKDHYLRRIAGGRRAHSLPRIEDFLEG